VAQGHCVFFLLFIEIERLLLRLNLAARVLAHPQVAVRHRQLLQFLDLVLRGGG
jgi:hypothetical protein